MWNARLETLIPIVAMRNDTPPWPSRRLTEVRRLDASRFGAVITTSADLLFRSAAYRLGPLHHPDDWGRELLAPGAAVEVGVTEVEDSAVSSNQVVALAVVGRDDADDRSVEALTAGAAVELGVTEGEDATVGGDLPVAPAIGGSGNPVDRLVQPDGTLGAEEVGVTEGENTAVRSDQVVALPIRSRGDPDDRL